MGASAAKKAGQQAADGSAAAIAENRRQFDTMLRLMTPSLQRGEQAAGVYMQALGLGGGQSPQPQSYQTPQTGSITSGGQLTGGFPQMLNVGENDMAVSPKARLMTGSYTNGQNGVIPPPQQVQTGPQPLPATGGQQGALDVASLVKQTPGYQAQLDQGLKAIDRAAPLVGGMYSGRRMKALADHGQNTFGSYYENWMNRVGGMAGQAPQIAQNVGQAGMQSAAQIGGLMVSGANAKANATMNSANAWSGAIGDAMGGFGWMGARQGWF